LGKNGDDHVDKVDIGKKEVIETFFQEISCIDDSGVILKRLPEPLL
jgi:hypothetical protein